MDHGLLLVHDLFLGISKPEVGFSLSFDILVFHRDVKTSFVEIGCSLEVLVVLELLCEHGINFKGGLKVLLSHFLLTLYQIVPQLSQIVWRLLKLLLLALLELVFLEEGLTRVDVLWRGVRADIKEIHVRLHVALFQQFDA